MRKAVFLDRDGTINVEKNYLYRIEDFVFLPGVLAGLKRFQEAGYLLIILTNQSGIARGYYTEREYKKLEAWMLAEFEKEGIKIDAVYYCPHLTDADVEEYRQECECRKPLLGMFKKAIAEYDIDIDNSVAIGDKMRDLAICDICKAQGYLVYGADCIEKKCVKSNIYSISGGIAEAAEYVLKGDGE